MNEDEPCCRDWKEQVDAINTYMTMSHILSALPHYDGPGFRYCPWCGAEKELHRREADAQ